VNVFNIDRVPRGNDDAGGEEHGYSVKATMKQLAGLNIKHHTRRYIHAAATRNSRI
jgi:hypothetical protein